MSDSYIINDITNLAASIRKNAAMSFSETYSEDLDQFVSIKQVENIILDHTDQDEEGSLIMNEDQYDSIFDDVRDFIFNVGLAKLAAEDKIQCAWDDEENRMIFWHS